MADPQDPRTAAADKEKFLKAIQGKLCGSESELELGYDPKEIQDALESGLPDDKGLELLKKALNVIAERMTQGLDMAEDAGSLENRQKLEASLDQAILQKEEAHVLLENHTEASLQQLHELKKRKKSLQEHDPIERSAQIARVRSAVHGLRLAIQELPSQGTPEPGKDEADHANSQNICIKDPKADDEGNRKEQGNGKESDDDEGLLKPTKVNPSSLQDKAEASEPPLSPAAPDLLS